MDFRTAAIVLSTFLFLCCGGESPSSPTSTPLAQATSTTLTVVSGEGGAAVSGAKVNVDGQAYTTKNNGTVVVSGSLGSIYIDGGNDFLKRETRYSGASRFDLWPITDGIGKAYLREIVYSEEWNPGARLIRLVSSKVSVVLPPSWRKDQRIVEAHRRAISILNAAQGGVRFRLDTEETAHDIRIDCVLDTTREGGAAFASRDFSRYTIVGGRIVYTWYGYARNPSLITHELGHFFGLGHSIDKRDIMAGSWGKHDFTQKEKRTMRMMLKRPPGNAFPDTDSGGLAQRTFPRTQVIVCNFS